MRLQWTCFFALMIQYYALAAKDEWVSSVGDSSSSDFWAARGRRAAELTSSSAGKSPEDMIFWANRGKRSSFNLPKPNNFLFPSSSMSSFMDKRKFFNLPRPNGFMFPTSSGNAKKRGSLLPYPRSNTPSTPTLVDPYSYESRANYLNYFLENFPYFILHDKRNNNYNLPKPNNFFFLSKNPKRSEDFSSKLYNFPKPNGFLWPAKKIAVSNAKRSNGGMYDSDASLEARINDLMIPGISKYSSSKAKRFTGLIDENELRSYYDKRGADELSGDIFFAGRGKKSLKDVDLDTFFAGRGRRSNEENDSRKDEEDHED